MECCAKSALAIGLILAVFIKMILHKYKKIELKLNKNCTREGVFTYPHTETYSITNLGIHIPYPGVVKLRMRS